MTKGIPNKVNESFFDHWSPDLAYFVGLMATDGYMGDRTGKKAGHQVQLVLTDLDLIESVADAIGYEGKITHRPPRGIGKKDRWGIKFGNKYVFDRLVKLGVTPRKTYWLTVSPVPHKLFGHYFRGAIDGDGTITRSKNSQSMRLITASADFAYGMRNEIRNIVGIEMSVYIATRSTNGQPTLYWLMAGGYGNLRNLHSFMYPNETVLCLDRKRRKLEDVISCWGPDIRGNSIWRIRNEHSPKELKELHYQKRIPLKQIAQIWGVKYSSIRDVASEWGIKAVHYGDIERIKSKK